MIDDGQARMRQEIEEAYALQQAVHKYFEEWESINHIHLPSDFNEAMKTILAFEIHCALDPTINEDAKRIYDKGYADGVAGIEELYK